MTAAPDFREQARELVEKFKDCPMCGPVTLCLDCMNDATAALAAAGKAGEERGRRGALEEAAKVAARDGGWVGRTVVATNIRSLLSPGGGGC
jgi:hypothetical protein